jgi:hypothetical protein
MVLDKQRAWQPLLLAIYLSMRGDVFYSLLSVNGPGDKETLPYAWLALGRGKYGRVPHGVEEVSPGWAKGKYGVAMLQKSPDGVPLFLHAHYPKLDVPRRRAKLPPAAPRNYKRFTGPAVPLPAGVNRSNVDLNSYEVLNAIAGVDVEVEVRQLRNYLRCQPAWVACCMR